MEALLSEIRQLRQDLEAAATATRKAQIILYRLHVQELEAQQMELETDLMTEQAKRDRLQDELDRVENSLGNSALQASDRR
jgi:hypothetical protein